MSASLEIIAEKAISFAREEIHTHGVPDMILLDISLDKGRHIAGKLGANIPLVEIGVAMMDVKLGQAFQEKRIPDHIQMSLNAAEEFLSAFDLAKKYKEVVLNAVKGHHGGVKFLSLEAQICANADCYRFIHPKGVFLYFTILGKRYGNFEDCLKQVEAKMDEKMKIVSLPLVEEELRPMYDIFKEYIALARS